MSDYRKDSAINHSLLREIDPFRGGSPQKFKHALENGQQLTGKNIELGTLIHEYILEPDKFAVVSATKMTEKGKIVADIIWTNSIHMLEDGTASFDEILSDNEYILDLLGDVAYYGNMKPDNRLSKFKTEALPYLEKCFEFKDKTLVSDDILAKIMKMATSLRTHRAAKKVIELESQKHIEVFNELEIYWERYVGGENMKLKAKLDKVIVDHEKKTFSVFDLKSTSKAVSLFMDHAMNYDYTRQLAFYRDAMNWYLENTKKLEGYKPSPYHSIIAVESSSFYEVMVYRFSSSDLDGEAERYMDLLERVQWHFNMNEWYYPKGMEQKSGPSVIVNVNLQ